MTISKYLYQLQLLMALQIQLEPLVGL
uniref:Uncharacterized protein n=1 Tax=Rhizophora mucronata TaxID=61149 RepID=A0A2P2IJ32_RHIMU